MPLKRFLVFTGTNYYPSGGWCDFADSFDTFKEAEAYLKSELEEHTITVDWGHIVDTQTGTFAD